MKQTICINLSDKNFHFLENRMSMVGLSEFLDTVVNDQISRLADMYYLQKQFNEYEEDKTDDMIMEEHGKPPCGR